MVGKVTVAMLERNLLRLYYNFHHPNNRMLGMGQGASSKFYEDDGGVKKVDLSWRSTALQVYNACVATAILAAVLAKK